VFSIFFLFFNPVSAQWQQTIGALNKNIKAFQVSGTNLFAGAYDGDVFLSTNNGSNWNAVNTDLTNKVVTAMTIQGTNLFVGTDGGGVFLSTNNGTNWTGVNTGLSNKRVHAMIIHGGTIFAGTAGGGIWKRSLSQITSVESMLNNFPANFTLQQNYPNPFNPSTQITYSIPKLSNVSIKVYDILGQEIATIVNDKKLKDLYTLRWDAQNVPTGLYFYRLVTGEYELTKKMIITK
jgi:hypothetical protein